MKYFTIYILVFLSFISCQKTEFEFAEHSDEQFFVEVGEAIMPVIVRGKTSSKTFCLVLHGGPGDSGIQSFYHTNTFNQLESEVAMVYFDQRCSGLSQGKCDGTTLEIAHFINDIDKIIELLHFQYADDIDLFILGHSWGATLALDYLINGKYKQNINGCIQSNGSHSIPMLSHKEKEYLGMYADDQISKNNNIEFWKRTKSNIQDLDPDDFDDRISIVLECYKTLNPLMDVGMVNPVTVKMDKVMSFLSNSSITYNNEKINNNRTFYGKLLAYDNTSQLGHIDTPIGLLWGRHDLVHPPIMAETIFKELGSERKELFFFEQSHHAPMMHENELYQRKVSQFINANK